MARCECWTERDSLSCVGVRVVNEQFRDGEKVREGSLEVWEFDQQGNAVVLQQPFQIEPGDSFRTSCYYRESGSTGTKFGLGSDEEMCIAFMFYYPRKFVFDGFPWFCGYRMDFLEACDAPHELEALPSEAALGRHFGELSATSECKDTQADSGTSQPTATPSGSENAFKTFVMIALVAGSVVLM